MPTHPQNASAPAHWSYQGERILLNGLCVAMSQNKSDTIANAMNSHARLTEQNAALVKALELQLETVKRAYRFAKVGSTVFIELAIIEENARAALAQSRTP